MNKPLDLVYLDVTCGGYELHPFNVLKINQRLSLREIFYEPVYAEMLEQITPSPLYGLKKTVVVVGEAFHAQYEGGIDQLECLLLEMGLPRERTVYCVKGQYRLCGVDYENLVETVDLAAK